MFMRNNDKRAKMALYCSPDYQTRFELIGLSVQETKFNIDVQDGGHLGCPIRMILSTFNLQVTLILPMKFRLIGLLFHDKKKIKNRFSTWLLGRLFWISDQNDFRHFWSTKKKEREKSRECHYHKPQPFPDPKRKRKPTNLNKHKPNKRTKSTMISYLFPKRGNRNTKSTEKPKNKMTHGKTYNTTNRLVE